MPVDLGIGAVLKVFKSYSNRLLAILIVLATVVAEGVVELSVYRCPCEHILRKQYAIPFLVTPVFLLLVAGIVFNQKARKQFVQCCWSSCSNKDQTRACSCLRFGEYLNIFGFASIAPSVWIVLILLDGDYVACAFSSVAYGNLPNETCIPNETPFTVEYRNHKRQSQMFGWIVAGIFGAVALMIHCIVQHKCSSMTDNEQKLRSECEQIVDEALVKACRQHAEEAAMASFTSNDSGNHGLQVDSDTFWKSCCERFETKREHVMKATMEKFLANRNGKSGGYRQDECQPPTNLPNSTDRRREDTESTSNPTLPLHENLIEMDPWEHADDISSTSARVLLINE